jgi:hypothetical protein
MVHGVKPTTFTPWFVGRIPRCNKLIEKARYARRRRLHMGAHVGEHVVVRSNGAELLSGRAAGVWQQVDGP